MLKSLQNCGWPIREHDINAVEREIELAYKYIQQSKDIRDLIVRKEDIIHKETIVTTENVLLCFEIIYINHFTFLFNLGHEKARI